MFVANNGHSAVVNFLPKGCDDNTPTIAQGNLPAVYELAQFHFHWGSKHHKGSEHEIHGVIMACLIILLTKSSNQF